MKIDQDLITSEYLEKLMNKIASLVAHQIAANNIEHGVDEYQNLQLNDFAYTLEGANFTQASTIKTYKKNWTKASFNLSSEIYKLSEFLEAEKHLREKYADQYAIVSLQSFIYKILPFYYEGNDEPDHKTLKIIKEKVIRELNGEPVNGIAVAYISGIILESESFKIDQYALLRQSAKNDFEKASIQDLQIQNIFPFSTAVLEINFEMTERDGAILQQKVEEYVALLRLFFPGSIQYKSYHINFDIITPLSSGGNMAIAERPIHIWKNYVFKKSEELIFSNFIKKQKIPSNLYVFDKKIDYLSTSFDRYSEALLEQVAIERRVANAIMGIEALLSKENDELSFRIQTRTSKLMAILGYQPIMVRTQLSKAYTIRSTFAHGGYLADKAKAKFNADFGNIDNFASLIINYLRLVIIITIVSKIDKKILINLIDDSLIDENRAKELKSKLKNVKQFIRL